MSRQRASQLIQGAKIVQDLTPQIGVVADKDSGLSTRVDKDSEIATTIPENAPKGTRVPLAEIFLPTTEKQTRELAKVPAEQRAEVMREATQDGAVKPTTQAVKEAAAKTLKMSSKPSKSSKPPIPKPLSMEALRNYARGGRNGCVVLYWEDMYIFVATSAVGKKPLDKARWPKVSLL